MAEYLRHRCCMCPQVNQSSPICPGIPGILHPDPTPCRFVKQYRDGRGWIYFVRPGIGGTNFKTFFQKPGKNPHCWRPATWRDTFDEAQADLNAEAKKRGWREA